MRTTLHRISTSPQRGRSVVESWLQDGIAVWTAEGRITVESAAGLRRDLEKPAIQEVMPHLGVHAGIALVIPLPFASLARFLWTLSLLAFATLRFFIGRIDRFSWSHAASIHSPLVMLIGILPVVGSLAYLFSAPVRSNRLLLRVSLDTALVRVPWNLYERLRLRSLIALPAPETHPPNR